MKKFYLSLVVACAFLMVACGNSEVEKIRKIVVDATEQTKNAESVEEVGEIAVSLGEAMEKITAESGDLLTFGEDVDEVLADYEKAVKEKFAELGFEVEEEL